MATVLVVDDSSVDRRLLGRLLGKDADLEVDFAADGAEALAKMEKALPDLVLTDLVMPQIDGLELMEAIRRQYPLVPVILVTGKGNEGVAVRALQKGAASYVPKRTLFQDLLDTVRNVLAVSGRRRSQTRLLDCMTKSHCTFVLDNDCTLFAPLVTYLQEGLAQVGFSDQTERTRIGVALEEALANALYRGNLELGSELRAINDIAYHALVSQRRRQAPYCDRRIRVEAILSRDEVVFHVVDEGPGFDPSNMPDPTNPANLDKPSGRGVLLMHTFMDEVVYNAAGNRVTLVKRRNAR